MSSSFRRRQRPRDAAVSGLAGTKPWTGGITLTSVGLRDLDAILGGGQPLGTCILLEQDRWTRDLALCLIKYWCAEAVSHGQTLMLPTTGKDDDEAVLADAPPSLIESEDGFTSPFPIGTTSFQVKELLHSLPRNLHWDKATATEAAATESERTRPLEILEEEEEEEEGLEIAWQYRKNIQKERLGHAGGTSSATVGGDDNVYCHSYNLSGRLEEQRSVDNHVTFVDGSCCETVCCSGQSCGFRMYQRILAHLKQSLASCKNKVVRLLLYQAPIQATSVALPLLLAYIRAHQLPVVIMVTTLSWTSRKGLVSLRRSSDVVLQTEGFASRVHYPPPPEFRHLHGLLLLPKVDFKRPPADVYGLKRDRRKLHISLLHIPPEDYAGGGGSVGGGGVRSGAGRSTTEQSGCGGGGGTSLLDF